MKLKVCLLILWALFVASKASWADLQSTNYTVQSSLPTGGGSVSVTSTNYKVEEGSIDWVTKADLSSANYKADSNIGIAGLLPIAVIQSTSPSDFAKFYTDQSASITVSATTPDNDPLQYQANQDGTLKAGPQASSTLSWALGVSDKGRHRIDLSVIDPDGTVTKTESMYVYRRPVK